MGAAAAAVLTTVKARSATSRYAESAISAWWLLHVQMDRVNISRQETVSVRVPTKPAAHTSNSLCREDSLKSLFASCQRLIKWYDVVVKFFR